MPDRRLPKRLLCVRAVSKYDSRIAAQRQAVPVPDPTLRDHLRSGRFSVGYVSGTGIETRTEPIIGFCGLGKTSLANK